MAKVIAIFEIIRPGEVIPPGKSFTSTGEELDTLTKIGAVRKPTKDDAEQQEGDDQGTEGNAAELEAQKQAAKVPAKTSGKDKGKVAAKSDDDGI